MLRYIWLHLLWISVVFPAFGYTPPMENQARKPEAAEAGQILRTVCGAAATVDETRMLCTPCPDFTSLHGLTTERFQLRWVLSGNFTAPGSQDLAVFFEGCEPLSDNFGGAVLLNKTGEGWKFARYVSAMRPAAVRVIRHSSGRDLLFCLTAVVGLGLVNNTLETFDFTQQPATARQPALSISDTTRACGLEITKASLDKVSWQDQSFTVTVTWGRIKASPEYLKDCPDKIPEVPTQAYQLGFQFDGTRFEPAADSKSTFEQIHSR
jgi:hypothetical protein